MSELNVHLTTADASLGVARVIRSGCSELGQWVIEVTGGGTYEEIVAELGCSMAAPRGWAARPAKGRLALAQEK